MTAAALHGRVLPHSVDWMSQGDKLLIWGSGNTPDICGEREWWKGGGYRQKDNIIRGIEGVKWGEQREKRK